MLEQILAAGNSTVSGSTASAWVAPTIVIAIVALAVSLATFFLTGRRARLDRQRQVFADAFSAVAEYREYPFIVLRRDPAEPAKERQRIGGDLSEVQSKLNSYGARLRVEERFVGDRYRELVAATRRVAGSKIREAWNREPVAIDADVHNPGWNFSDLDSYDDTFLRAVADHLGWLHAPLRRKLRRWFDRSAVQPVDSAGATEP
jgi:hypothetical protein